MMPLWTIATSPVQSQWGWALRSTAAPCVAQRVWPMPAVMPAGASSATAARSASRERPRSGVAPAPEAVLADEDDPGRVVAAVLEQGRARRACTCQRLGRAGDADDPAHALQATACRLAPVVRKLADHDRDEPRRPTLASHLGRRRLRHHPHERLGARRPAAAHGPGRRARTRRAATSSQIGRRPLEAGQVARRARCAAPGKARHRLGGEIRQRAVAPGDELDEQQRGQHAVTGRGRAGGRRGGRTARRRATRPSASRASLT